MADFPDICPDDETLGLEANNQIFESVLTGQTQTAQLTGDKWTAQPSFSNRHGTEAKTLQAFIFGLGGTRGTFNYSPFSIDQQGTMSGNGVVDGAGQTGSVLNTKGWDFNQPDLFKIGDYLSFNGELKLITGDVDNTANTYIEYDGTNLMPSPFDPEGWYGATSEPDGTITNVTIDNPSGQSFVGLFESLASSNAILNRFNSISINRGESQVISYLHRDVSGTYQISSQFTDGSGANPTEELVFNPDGTIAIGNNDLEYDVQYLEDEFKIISVKYTVDSDSSDMDGLFYVRNPIVGANAYFQAAFFGKNPLPYPYAMYNEFEDASEAGEWTASNVNLTSGAGVLAFVATGSDPRINMLKSIDGSVFSEIKIRWRRNSGTANNEFFWGNGNGAFGPSRNITFGANDDPEAITTGPDVDGFYDTVINLQDFAEWNGQLGGMVTAVRFDFGFDATSDFEIDYIKVYSPSLLSDYENWWPANVLANAQIPITPPIRVSPADNNAIETTKPFFVGRLEDDDQARVSVSSPIIYNSTLSIKEAF